MDFNFSDFLKHELSKKILKANELAKLIDKVPSYITKIQKENIIPNYKDLKIIARAFGISYEFLLFQIGIIDTNTLIHINAFGSLKSYLAEIFNLTDMTKEKRKIFNDFIDKNEDKLNDELTDELMIETMDFLGNDFIFPNYKNPYTEHTYPGYKKIPKVTFPSVQGNQSNVQSKMLPVYYDLNENGDTDPISQFPTTQNVLATKATDIGNEIFWYSPTKNISNDLYLIEKVSVNNGDRLLYKNRDKIYTGIYSSTPDSIIITNIFDTQQNTSIDGPPVIISTNDRSTNMFIIGKVLSVFKTA